MIAFEPSMLTKPRAGAKADPLHLINRGLKGWWLFNEGSGRRIADISGNGHHGTVNNVDLASAWIGSKHGGGISTDGVDDFITIPDANSFSGLSAITVVANVSSLSSDSVKTLLSHDGGDPNSSWRLNQEATGRLGIILSGDGGAANTKLYRTNVASTPLNGTWHQVGFTFSDGTLDLWVDGIRDLAPQIVLDNAITSLFDTTSALEFGRRVAATEWNGIFGDMRLYDRALNDQEMRLLNMNPFVGLLA